MSYKQQILDFMRKKDEILLRYTGMHIFDESLFESTITEETCEEMTKMLIARKYFRNSNLCPWCVQYNSCISCTYGKTYGICIDTTSKYSDFIDELSDKLSNIQFSNILEIEHVLEKFKKQKDTN